MSFQRILDDPSEDRLQRFVNSVSPKASTVPSRLQARSAQGRSKTVESEDESEDEDEDDFYGTRKNRKQKESLLDLLNSEPPGWKPETPPPANKVKKSRSFLVRKTKSSKDDAPVISSPFRKLESKDATGASDSMRDLTSFLQSSRDPMLPPRSAAPRYHATPLTDERPRPPSLYRISTAPSMQQSEFLWHAIASPSPSTSIPPLTPSRAANVTPYASSPVKTNHGPRRSSSRKPPPPVDESLLSSIQSAPIAPNPQQQQHQKVISDATMAALTQRPSPASPQETTISSTKTRPDSVQKSTTRALHRPAKSTSRPLSSSFVARPAGEVEQAASSGPLADDRAKRAKRVGEAHVVPSDDVTGVARPFETITKALADLAACELPSSQDERKEAALDVMRALKAQMQFAIQLIDQAVIDGSEDLARSEAAVAGCLLEG